MTISRLSDKKFLYSTPDPPFSLAFLLVSFFLLLFFSFFFLPTNFDCCDFQVSLFSNTKYPHNNNNNNKRFFVRFFCCCVVSDFAKLFSETANTSQNMFSRWQISTLNIMFTNAMQQLFQLSVFVSFFFIFSKIIPQLVNFK